MKNRGKKRIWLLCGIFMILFTAVFSYNSYRMQVAKAAFGVININDDETTGVYYLRRQNMPAYVENVQSGSSVKWTTSNTSVFRINNNTSSEVVSSSGTVTLQAVGIGEATLTAEYTDTEGTDHVLTRVVSVPSAIMEDSAFFGMHRAEAEQSVMILDLSSRATGTLSLLYDVPSGITVTWTSSNPYVVSMDPTDYKAENETGYFRATGAGKTKITVAYTVDAHLVTSSVDVFVGPKVTVGNQEAATIYAKKGDFIDLGANTTGNNGTINDKVYWVLTDNNGNVLEDCTKANKTHFSSNPYSSQIEVTGRAGYYYLYVFTAETYLETDNLASNGINQYLKKVVEFRVLPEPFSNMNNPVSLQVGDSYDVADMFNMSVEDFNKYFDYSVTPATRGDFLNGKFTSTETGASELTITYKNGQLEAFTTFLHDTPDFPYKIAVNSYKGFSLDRSEAAIFVGTTLKLSTVYSGNKGKITWKSEDESYVSVVGQDTSAIITGVRATGDNYIKVTAYMTLTDGRTLTATCKVKVGTTATEITLNETDLTLKMGATATITASFKPETTTSVDLKWLLTDDSIVDLSVNSEKSVVVTAKKAGTTILTAVNTDNYITAYCTIKVSSAITKLTLNYTELSMTLSQETVKLRAEYEPKEATLTNLIWSSSDTSIATVDDGLVKFVSPGTCIITVQPEWNENFVMAQCRITISASPTGFSLDKTAITLEAGEKETLKPILVAANSTTTVTWTSTNAGIASVSKEGVVTANSPGVAYIVATTKEGLIASCTVTVTQKASGITLSTYNIKLAVGEKTTVTAKPTPATSTETKFTWTSREPAIATVSDGVVTGVKTGSTIILVKTKKGDVAYLYVTVYDKATSMSLNYANRQIAKGTTFTLKPVFTPSSVTNKNVTWESLNPKVASVSQKGKVKGIKGGAAIITATSEDGNYLATCLVTVVEPVTNVKLNYKSYKLGIGKTVTLKATVTSNSASNNKVKWSTSNSKIATVNSAGKVKGKKLGTCTITAKVTDGTKKKATCKIKVVRQVTSMSMNKSVLTVVVNKTAKLSVKVKPSNATYKNANWSSSNSEVAIVDSKGNVTGISVGNCTITAAAKDNSKKKVTCYVNVIKAIPTSSILLAAKDLVMIKGQSQMLSYTVTPADHTDKIYFASDNKSVATISGTGKIYARRTGAATITVTSDSGKQTTVSVTVIGLNKTSVSLEQYDTETIVVDGAPTGVTWYSKDPSVATVSGGKIVARKPGVTTVYARVSGVILSCRVSVSALHK